MFFIKNLFALAFLIIFSANFAFAQETGSVKGKVRAASGGAIAGVTVTARQNGEDVKSVVTDAGGKFALENLKTGIYNFVFDKNGYSSGVRYNIEVRKKKTVDLGDRLILTVDQGTLVLIRGSVFDQNGYSLYGADVKVEKIFGDGSARKISSGLTNRSGEFSFRQAEQSAKFRVTASMKGATASKEISVESAGIYRVALTLNLEKE